MTKKELRRTAKEKRDALSPEQVSRFSADILQKLLAHPWYNQSHTIFTYVSMGNEVQTHKLIMKALDDGKRVCVPKVTPGEFMTAIRINSMTAELERGFFEVLEPINGLTAVSEREIDLVIVPGLLFDRKGYRIGYGGGYYDKYLNKITADCKTIGLTFSSQIVHSLPHEEHDMRVMLVLTEKEMIG